MSSTKQSIREIFDTISLNVIGFLENHIGITEVDLTERSGVAEISITKWEEENSSFQLPMDYKAFLQISDGLSLNWKIKKNDQSIALGCMHLNKLRDIKKIKGEYFRFSRIGADDDEDSSDEDNDNEEEKQKDIHAFDIDSDVKDGRLALMYRGTNSKPQIWFQDLSCKWFFIANSFTDYFRLMIMHLGIPNWQYAFTKVGLDPQTLQWFRFLIPERLAIDIENRKNLEYLNRKRNGQPGGMKQNQNYKFANDKIKIEGLKRKRRRMKQKAKPNNEGIIEKFTAQSSKTAKYAKSVVRKREASELKTNAGSNHDVTSVSGSGTGAITVVSGGGPADVSTVGGDPKTTAAAQALINNQS